MTRKDFEQIARDLYWSHPRWEYAEPANPTEDGYEEKLETWRRTVKQFRNTLALNNPRFDKEKFTKFCLTNSY